MKKLESLAIILATVLVFLALTNAPPGYFAHTLTVLHAGLRCVMGFRVAIPELCPTNAVKYIVGSIVSVLELSVGILAGSTQEVVLTFLIVVELVLLGAYVSRPVKRRNR